MKKKEDEDLFSKPLFIIMGIIAAIILIVSYFS